MSNFTVEDKEILTLEPRTGRHTKSLITTPTPLVVITVMVFMLLALVFLTDNVIDTNGSLSNIDMVTGKLVRESVIESTTTVVAQQQSQTKPKSANLTNLTLPDVENRVFEIPYTMTNEQIGGYSTSMSKSVRQKGVGVSTSRLSSLERMKSIFSKSAIHVKMLSEAYVEEEAVMVRGRYTVAIGRYFFPSDGFVSWSSAGTGYCFDIVLLDGTVIPCVKLDSKADGDTNSDASSPLHIKKYKNLFQRVDGSIFEFGAELNSSVSKITKKLGISEKNPPVSVVLYNATYEDIGGTK